MRFKNKLFLWMAVLAVQAMAVAQTGEPLELTIDQAEKMFFQKNFLLLAQQYDIKEADAQILQAKLYPNPEVSLDFVGYEGETNQYFPVGKNGQFAGDVEQLIILGGKRRLKIDLAKLDKKKAEAELTELTRNLQLDLWQSFYTLHHQQKLIEKYDTLLSRLEFLIDSYETQVKKNNIPLKDLVRLKSVYVKINNDKSEESQTLIEQQQKLNLLLGMSGTIKTVYTDETVKAFADKTLSYDEILKQALAGRGDLQQLQVDAESVTKNLSLQKRSAIPDITLSAGYNRRGDAYNDQVGVGIGFPLPFFDRNQGNIKAAKIEKQKTEETIPYKQLEITNEVLAGYQDFTRSAEEYKRIVKIINADFDTVFAGINSNFQKGNVSMIEFADFFESYNDAQTEAERVKRQLALAAAQINYVSGTKIF